MRTADGREATTPKANHFSSVELENDFAASFALGRVRHRRLRLINRVCLLDFRFQKAAPGHVEQRFKCFHSLRHRRVVVPFIDPDSAEPQVFENKQTGRDLERLQTHCPERHQRTSEGKTIGQTQSALPANSI